MPCHIIQSSRGAFANQVCFPLSFLTFKFLDVQKKYIFFFDTELWSKQNKIFSKLFNEIKTFTVDYSDIVSLHKFITRTKPDVEVSRYFRNKTSLYNQILIILWCLHFGCCTGKEKRKRSERSHRKRKLTYFEP